MKKKNTLTKKDKIRLFLRWFFLPRGTTKVHPLAILTTEQRTIAESLPILRDKFGYKYPYQCVICGTECQSKKEHPDPPVCMRWACFRDFYLGNCSMGKVLYEKA